MRFTPHRLIEGCLITAHGIESRSVFIYIRGEYRHEFEVMRDALEDARKAKLLGGVSIVLHRGAGAYICGEETGLLESLEGQRGQPRPRPPFPPVNGLLRRADADQQREHDRARPEGVRARRGRVLEDRRSVRAGDRRLLALRQRRAARELRAADGDDDPRADLRRRRRRRRRTRAEGDHPGRLLGAGAHAHGDRHADGLRLDRRCRLVLRLGRDHRRRRPLLHGAARAAGRAVLHARVVREVHALPRGDTLARPAADEDRAGDGEAADLDLLDERLRPDAREVAVRARRLRGLPRGELPAEVPRRVRKSTSRSAGVRSRATVRSRDARAGRQHAHGVPETVHA